MTNDYVQHFPHPSVYVEQFRRLTGLSAEEFSATINISAKKYRYFIDKLADMSIPLANRLHLVTGIPSADWFFLQYLHNAERAPHMPINVSIIENRIAALRSWPARMSSIDDLAPPATDKNP